MIRRGLLRMLAGSLIMRGDGGTAPAPAGYVPPSLPGVAVGPFSGIFRGRLVIVQGTGPNTGLFVYTGTPALGNPPIFWATNAAKDPFGNKIPSTAGVAGTGTFQAGNTIINKNGTFIYSGTPSATNLIISECPVATTDPFGTATVAGVGLYITAGGQVYTLTFGPLSGIPGMSINQSSGGAFLQPSYGGFPAASTGAALNLNSGQALNTSVASTLTVSDSTQAGKAHGSIVLGTGFAALGTQQNWWVDDTLNPAQLLTAFAGSGPFLNGETFHNVSLPSGWSGQFRVKKLPWNAVLMNVQLNSPSTAGGLSAVFGSLPDSTYYPFFSSHWPLAMTGAFVATSGSFAGTPRLNVPNSGSGGALHLEIPSLAASALLTFGAEIMYPTN